MEKIGDIRTVFDIDYDKSHEHSKEHPESINSYEIVWNYYKDVCSIYAWVKIEKCYDD